ncbi:hypothetical protein SAMN05444955_102202 [Lihuaxuella thermophila]|uniref:Uncharacterized protein n=1 Tax=Lihuaxuella thermophila TaxID=1173111 RepID=A0A1H8BIF0_9BACL|nr:hypothetical protein SAMN05444955_102202 [Lihuaxuella thermophila]
MIVPIRRLQSLSSFYFSRDGLRGLPCRKYGSITVNGRIGRTRTEVRTYDHQIGFFRNRRSVRAKRSDPISIPEHRVAAND